MNIPKELRINPIYRDGTNDKILWHEVVNRNVYNISKADMNDTTVIDIGSHIGAFTTLALCLGASKVIAVDPSEDNHSIFIKNIEKLKNKVDAFYKRNSEIICVDKGLWIDDDTILSISSFPKGHANRINTGGCYTIENTAPYSTNNIYSISIQCILKIVNTTEEQNNLIIKTDCEGAEAAIFLNLTELKNRCKLIVGEYHLTSPTFIGIMEKAGLKDTSYEDLKYMLSNCSKNTYITKPVSGRGIFWLRCSK